MEIIKRIKEFFEERRLNKWLDRADTEARALAFEDEEEGE